MTQHVRLLTEYGERCIHVQSAQIGVLAGQRARSQSAQSIFPTQQESGLSLAESLLDNTSRALVRSQDELGHIGDASVVEYFEVVLPVLPSLHQSGAEVSKSVASAVASIRKRLGSKAPVRPTAEVRREIATHLKEM